MTSLDLTGAKARAEEKLGFEVDPITAMNVLAYAARKCVVNRKDTEYLETLYETELLDHFTRLAITVCSKKGAAHVLP